MVAAMRRGTLVACIRDAALQRAVPDGLVDAEVTGRTLEAQRHGITAAHWRRLLRPARSRGQTAIVRFGGAACRHGQARVDGARMLTSPSDGASAPLRAKRAGRRLLKKRRTGEDPVRLPKARDRAMVVSDEGRIGQKNKLKAGALDVASRPRLRPAIQRPNGRLCALRSDLSSRRGRAPGLRGQFEQPTPKNGAPQRSVPPSKPMRC